jgi:hypothetical protein
MDTGRLGRGEMIAAVSAVALLLIMFIFKWFGVEIDSGLGDLGTASVSANAWQSFGVIDLILFITIVVAVGLAVMKANQQSVNLPVAASALVAGLGILSVLLILFRIISPPDFGSGGVSIDGLSHTRKIGAFLGLIASAGIAYGGYLAMQEEGTTFSGQADRLQNRGGPGSGGGTDAPPPPPPPPPPARSSGSSGPPPAV